MIELNVDFSLLNRFFGISPTKCSQYANKDLEEIMKLEAQQGNEKAKNYEQILNDPVKVQDIFKLSNTENKYIILQNMSEQDLDNLVPYLTQNQLWQGLQFYDDDKLLNLCQQLPTEELIGVVFQQFTLMDVLKYMDDNSMDNFLKQPDVERRYAQKYFESIDNQTLEKIMIEAFGGEMKDKRQEEYLEKIATMDNQEFNKFILSLKKESKAGLINGIVNQDQELLLLFENKDLVRPMEQVPKEDKLIMMNGLDPEFLIPMIQELPLDLTQIVLTQINAKDFSEILVENFKDILSQVVLFSNKSM